MANAADKDGKGLWTGCQLGVVSGFQELSVTWVGSVDFFNDKFANKEISKYVYVSLSFCCVILILSKGCEIRKHRVRAWCRSLDIPRVFSADHHIANTTISKEQYTTNNPIVYSAAISRFNPKEDAWELYSDIKDTQLEFTMLDPHIHTALPPVAGKPGIYSTQFRVPDWHGVVKFVVDYKREGYVIHFDWNYGGV